MKRSAVVFIVSVLAFVAIVSGFSFYWLGNKSLPPTVSAVPDYPITSAYPDGPTHLIVPEDPVVSAGSDTPLGSGGGGMASWEGGSVYEFAPSDPPTPPVVGLNASTVGLLYATNRKETGEACEYGAERAEGNKLSYGACFISIPKDHRMGHIESPSWYEREAPDKHVAVLGGVILSKSMFDEHLSRAMSETGTSLVFVHGYNVSFRDAAKRTAQIAYDLNFKGVPLFFSWPSAGDPKRYPADEAAVEWSYPAMYSFLKDHLENKSVKKVYLIAHSMGNRALTAAIVRLNVERPDLSGKLKEIVLAAPDIDSGTFMDNILPAMIREGAPITLYVSSNDKALQVSKDFHNYPRAGDLPSVIKVVKGLELIDVSSVQTDFLSHSYYGDDVSVISDIYYLILGNRPPRRFNLVEQPAQGGSYWVFRK